jgi:hypothetical protein
VVEAGGGVGPRQPLHPVFGRAGHHDPIRDLVRSRLESASHVSRRKGLADRGYPISLDPVAFKERRGHR